MFAVVLAGGVGFVRSSKLACISLGVIRPVAYRPGRPLDTDCRSSNDPLFYCTREPDTGTVYLSVRIYVLHYVTCLSVCLQELVRRSRCLTCSHGPTPTTRSLTSAASSQTSTSSRSSRLSPALTSTSPALTSTSPASPP